MASWKPKRVEQISSSYIDKVVETGSQYIKKSHPEAADFRYINTKDFLEGKLTTIEFNDRGNSYINYIYDRDGEMIYYRSGDYFLSSVGALEKPSGLISTLLRREHVA